MNLSFKALVREYVESSLFWPFFSRFSGCSLTLRRWKNERDHYELKKSKEKVDLLEKESKEQRIRVIAEKIFNKKEVLNGPFRGMLYPDIWSHGSEIYPKLVGSYEQEIHSVVEEVCQKNYNCVVDIGAAEGYYAVGFARRLPKARVYAFDVDSSARRACADMADLNKVNIELGEWCSSETLEALELGERALIFCDCESYEKTLFKSSTVNYLSTHDVVVELHDFMEWGITPALLKLFKQTHECELISSVCDVEKVYSYDYKELEGLDYSQRFELLRERRPAIMKWLVARSKATS